jgi:hypothetical protein
VLVLVLFVADASGIIIFPGVRVRFKAAESLHITTNPLQHMVKADGN